MLLATLMIMQQLLLLPILVYCIFVFVYYFIVLQSASVQWALVTLHRALSVSGTECNVKVIAEL